MADFEIERPSVETNQISPTFNVNIPQFTIEVQGGVQGQRGEKGDPGEPGAPNVLSIGTVVSGDTANASITGTTPNQVLNLVLPQGEDGQDGQNGEDGVGIESVEQTTTSTEDEGNNIVTVTLTDGTTSTFTVQNGSKGSAGATGAQGPTGADGAKGDKGDKGDTGVGVESIEQTTTSHESGGTNIITATLTDGTTSEFYIKNGEAGGGGGGGTSNYNDLTNKPSINNITLTGNKTTSDLGINIPTQTSELTNNSGYITKSVSDLTNYTPTSSLATVATSGSYNDLSNTPTIPTVPTNVSAFTNDSGYITGITSSDIYNVLGYYPAAEPNIYAYNSIRQITSTSNQTYIDLMDDIANHRPIIIKLGMTEYVNALGTNYGNTTSLWFMSSDNTYRKITLTVSGTSVTVTAGTIEIPTKTSDLTNDSNFAVTNADNNFSVGQTIAGETVVDSIRTKNMFDKNSRVVYTSGSTYTILENGIRAINTSASENNNNIRFITIDLNNFLGKTLTLTANAKSSSSNPAHMYMCLSKKDGDMGSNPLQSSGTTLDGTLSVSYTIPSSVGDYHYLLIAFYSTRETTASVNSYVDYTNIQLEEGTTATTYAPYQNLDGIGKEIIETAVTPNSSYISTVQLNHVVKWGNVVIVNFRGLVSANIPNNTTIITLPYQVVNHGTCPAYLGGAYDYASTLWCSYSRNAFRAGGGFGSAKGKYVHIYLVYITND